MPLRGARNPCLMHSVAVHHLPTAACVPHTTPHTHAIRPDTSKVSVAPQVVVGLWRCDPLLPHRVKRSLPGRDGCMCACTGCTGGQRCAAHARLHAATRRSARRATAPLAGATHATTRPAPCVQAAAPRCCMAAVWRRRCRCRCRCCRAAPQAHALAARSSRPTAPQPHHRSATGSTRRPAGQSRCPTSTSSASRPCRSSRVPWVPPVPPVPRAMSRRRLHRQPQRPRRQQRRGHHWQHHP
jgi:hypothetical protein